MLPLLFTSRAQQAVSCWYRPTPKGVDSTVFAIIHLSGFWPAQPWAGVMSSRCSFAVCPPHLTIASRSPQVLVYFDSWFGVRMCFRCLHDLVWLAYLIPQLRSDCGILLFRVVGKWLAIHMTSRQVSHLVVLTFRLNRSRHGWHLKTLDNRNSRTCFSCPYISRKTPCPFNLL